jgi:hypothetical protein
MRRSGKGSGGGAGSKNVVRPGYKQGRAAKEMRHQAVAQIGSNLGDHVMGMHGKTAKSSAEKVEGLFSTRILSRHARELIMKSARAALFVCSAICLLRLGAPCASIL